MFSRRNLAVVSLVVAGMQGVGSSGSVASVTAIPVEIFTAPETHVVLAQTTADDVTVKVTMINRGPGIFRLLKWNLPQEGGMTNVLFEITRDGQPVRYTRMMVKRRVTPADYISMKPGRKYSATLGLAQAYDVKAPGQYKVRYRVYNQTASDAKKEDLISIEANELVFDKK